MSTEDYKPKTEKIYSNYRLEVGIAEPYWSFSKEDPHTQKRRALEALSKSIQRHVDDVGHLAQRWDIDEVCAFCGYEWVNATEEGVPACCDDAQKDYEQQTGVNVQ